MNGTGPALRDAAAELCSGQTQYVALHPEVRHVAGCIEGFLTAVYLQTFHRTDTSDRLACITRHLQFRSDGGCCGCIASSRQKMSFPLVGCSRRRSLSWIFLPAIGQSC